MSLLAVTWRQCHSAANYETIVSRQIDGQFINGVTVAEIENPGSTKGRDGKKQDTLESMAGIIISHGKTLDMQRRRKELEETFVSDNPHLGEGA